MTWLDYSVQSHSNTGSLPLYVHFFSVIVVAHLHVGEFGVFLHGAEELLVFEFVAGHLGAEDVHFLGTVFAKLGLP